MKKRVLSLVLAFMMCSTAPLQVSAETEEEIRQDQAWNSAQLSYLYAEIDALYAAKAQMQAQIESLNSELINVMVSIDILNQEITQKQEDIEKTAANLTKAQNAKSEQYESMKARMQYLFENGGSDAWFQMMLNTDDIADLLTRAEYTQKMYETDRKNLEKYVNTINEVEELQQRYESEQAELQEMEAELEVQSAELQYQIEVCQANSANYANEIAYAQQQAADYEAIIAQQQAQLERLEAERLAAEAAAAEAAAQAAAEEESYEEDYEDSDYDEDDYDEDDYDEDDYDEDDYDEDDYDEDSYDEDDYDEDSYDEDYSDEVEDSYEEETSSSSSSSSSGSAVASYATQFVGNPYVWGGTSLTNGADCSGFVQSVYASFGVSLPRTSYEQQSAGYEVSYADAQAGDLICYGGHVAIYLGDGKIVHASNSTDGIKISNDATYRTILSVRRLL